MSTGSITSLGIGSSLDLQGMLDTQREADEAVNDLKLENIEEQSAVKVSLNSVLNQLLSMKTSCLSLSLSSNYLYRTVSVADDTQMSASAIDGTAIGSHRIVTDRLASSSSYVSGGFASETASVYVPDTMVSTENFESGEIVLAEGETLNISLGSSENARMFSITGTAGGMTAQQLVDAVNASADNADDGGNALVTASLIQNQDGTVGMTLAAASGQGGEENRVSVWGNTTVGFAAPVSALSFTLGENKEAYTISVPANSSLEDLVERINEDEDNPGVTASIVNTGSGDTPYKLVLTADQSGEDFRITMVDSPPGLVLNEQQGSGYAMTGDAAISFDSAVVIDETNNCITFQEDSGQGYGDTLTAEIETGNYETAQALAAAVEEALETASQNQGNGREYSVSIDADTGKMRISEDGTLEGVAVNWGEADCSASAVLGFSQAREITPAEASLNALVSVDGISYQRTENTGLDDLVKGVTLSLYTTGVTTISVQADTTAVEETLTSLVDTYNSLIQEIDENDDYNEDEDSWGSLARSSTVKTLKTALAGLFTTTVDTETDIRSLVDLGIEVDDDGTMTLDADTLSLQLANNLEAVQSLLLGTGTQTGLADILNEAIGAYALSDGYINTEIDAIDTKIDRLESSYKTQLERIDKKYEIMAAEYTALDAYLAEIESTQSYIETVLASTEED